MQNTFNTKVTFNAIKSDISKSDSPIREAIANSVDANSKNIYLNLYTEDVPNSTVKVSYFCLDIADDGEGIPSNKQDFEKVFCRYKESTKKEKSNYGKKGRGRYTYLTLPKDPHDVSIFTKIKGDNRYFKINFNCQENENITINHTENFDQPNTPIKLTYTTLIQFKNLDIQNFPTVKKNDSEEYLQIIKNEILTFFTDRIASKSVKIYLNNELLKINDYLEKNIISEVFEINNFEDIIKFNVEFYIWNKDVKLKSDRHKHILFFNEKNNLKGIAPSGKNKLAFGGSSLDHTIIVKSKYFENRDFIDTYDTYDNLMSDEIIKKLKTQIKFRLEQILFKIYKENIDKVSEEYIKFLKLSQDEITQNVYHTLFLPFIAKFGEKKIHADVKSVIAKLIQTLASESPDSFIQNLQTILNLKEEESKKIQYIQENYGIIAAITEKVKIIERIDFLNKFDDLVHGDNSKSIKERTQLHHVIDKHLWLIDKDFDNVSYSDIVSDKSLQSILQNKKFYQFDSEELNKITSTYDIKKIPDIFIPIKKENLIYIIELKRPSQKINQTIIGEVMEKYIKTLHKINKSYAENNRKKIKGIAISSEKTQGVYSVGKLDQDGVEVIAKSWREVIEAARERCNEKISNLDNKLKMSKWKDLDDLILSPEHKS